MTVSSYQADPKLDLVLKRIVDVAPEKIWAAWTQSELLKQWFTPAPWRTVGCDIDLRPGGRFCTVMRSPDGQEFPNNGCYLEVIPNRKLVWTSALTHDYRPANPVGDGLLLTAIIELDPHDKGTTYTATAIHQNEAARKTHETMGFYSGWGTALDQLLALMKQQG